MFKTKMANSGIQGAKIKKFDARNFGFFTFLYFLIFFIFLNFFGRRKASTVAAGHEMAQAEPCVASRA